MPQFDPSSFPSQIFWMVVTFVVLYVLMTKIALPRIGDILEERQKRIADDLDMAERLKAETEASIAAYEKSLAEARSSAQAEIGKVMEANAAEAAARQKELQAQLSAKIAGSEARIHEAHKQAMTQVGTIAADLACAIVDRMAGLKTDEASVAPVIDTIAKEREA